MSLLEDLSNHFDRLRPETLREPKEGDFIKHPYGVPAGYYEQLWDWDGFFICQHLANRPEDPKPEYFQHWVKNFVSAYKELGYAPACITKDKPKKKRSDFTLKPFLAQACLKGSAGGNFDWIKEHYEDIREIATRREETNRDEATKLYFWDNAMSSGADNNAADSNIDELKGLYLACDLNAFLYEEYRALSEVAWAVGNALDAARFATEASTIKNAILEHLWNEKLGCFDNRRKDTGCFVNVISYSNFIPLVYKLGSLEQAHAMFSNYLVNGDHLMTPWGCRSLTRQDRAYNNESIIDPYSNWCGPIWPIANYFYFSALHRYGYYQDAEKIANRMGRTLLDDLESIGTMHENYCAETGKGLAPSKDHGPRNEAGGFIGWNLLIQDMLEAVEARASDLLPEAQHKAGQKPTPAETSSKTQDTEEKPVAAELPRPTGSVSMEAINAAFMPKKKDEELY